jgi:hypothetical protein
MNKVMYRVDDSNKRYTYVKGGGRHSVPSVQTKRILQANDISQNNRRHCEGMHRLLRGRRPHHHFLD